MQPAKKRVPSHRSRRGMALPLVLGLVIVVGMLLANLGDISRQQARQARTHEADAEHLYRAEAVVARVVNRLKRRSWDYRYYLSGPPSEAPFEVAEEGEYREGLFRVWVRDVSLPGVSAVPGLVDVLLEMVFAGISRKFHFRLSVVDGSVRRSPTVEMVYFGRTPEDIGSEEGRDAARDRATTAMIQEDQNELATERIGGGSQPGLDPKALAEGLLQTSLGIDSAAAIRKDLRTGIHLLGEDGRGFQGLLPPLQRNRFRQRQGDHQEARTHLERARTQARGKDLQRFVEATLVQARSFSASAFRNGPLSPEGQESLRDAWRNVSDAVQAIQSQGGGGLGGLDPTLVASVLFEGIRVSVLARRAGVPGEDWNAHEARMHDILQDLLGETPLFGGARDSGWVVSSVLEQLDDPGVNLRVLSDEPVEASGLNPVDKSEVASLLEDPTGGWQGYGDDSGLSDAERDQAWEAGAAGQAEGGDGSKPPFSDSDGDGVPDLSAQVEGNDGDLDGVEDGGELADSIVQCIDSYCAGELTGELNDCQRQCSQLVRQVREVGESTLGATRGDDGRSESNPVLEAIQERFGQATLVRDGKVKRGRGRDRKELRGKRRRRRRGRSRLRGLVSRARERYRGRFRTEENSEPDPEPEAEDAPSPRPEGTPLAQGLSCVQTCQSYASEFGNDGLDKCIASCMDDGVEDPSEFPGFEPFVAQEEAQLAAEEAAAAAAASDPAAASEAEAPDVLRPLAESPSRERNDDDEDDEDDDEDE